jgi:hypothetical protein
MDTRGDISHRRSCKDEKPIGLSDKLLELGLVIQNGEFGVQERLYVFVDVISWHLLQMIYGGWGNIFAEVCDDGVWTTGDEEFETCKLAIPNGVQKFSEKNSTFTIGYFVQSIDDDEKRRNQDFQIRIPKFPVI